MLAPVQAFASVSPLRFFADIFKFFPLQWKKIAIYILSHFYDVALVKQFMSHPIENLKFEDDKKEVKRPKPLQKPKSKVSKPKPKHIPKSSKTSETDSMSINADESFAGCEINSETVVVVRALSGGPDDLIVSSTC